MPGNYLVFYKPYGVLSSFTDPEGQGRPCLADYIPIPGVYAAGRLDKNSEGLMLLTDDGQLNHRITHPDFEHTKTYFTQVEGTIGEEAVETLSQGLALGDFHTLPADVSIIPEPDLPPKSVPVRDYHPTSWLKITLREGKKHQVRRMTAAVGYPTLRLFRIAIGELTLEGLKPGEWRYLDSKEVQLLTV